jgi:hypothetical protein
MNYFSSRPSRAPLKNTRLEVFRSVQVKSLACVIPAWSAGIQTDTDVPGRIQRSWMPALHAGMTKSSFSCFVSKRKSYETLRGKASFSHFRFSNSFTLASMAPSARAA